MRLAAKEAVEERRRLDTRYRLVTSRRRFDCQKRCISLLAPWITVQPGVARWPLHVSLALEKVAALSKAMVSTLQEIEHLL